MEGTNAASTAPAVPQDIIEAAKAGDLELVRKFVELDRYKVNAADSDGATVLHWAAFRGSVPMAKYLLDAGANINAATLTEGQTPVHWAAITGDPATLHCLVKHGADVFAVDKRGYNIVHHAVQYEKTLCIFYGLAKGINVDVPDNEGHTPLMWAAYQGLENIITFLVARGASLHAKDKTGFTALHWAASRGYMNCAVELVKVGSDVTALTHEGQNPEQLAVAKGNPSVANIIRRTVTGKRKGCITSVGGLDVWTVIGATMVPTFLLLLSYLPWYLSIPLLAAYVYAVKNYLPACPGSDVKHPLWAGWFVSAFGVSALVYFLQILPGTSDWFFSHLIFICANFFGLVPLYFYVSKSDAGRVTPNSFSLQNLEEAIEQNKPIGEVCPTCMALKPLRSKHCRACGKCIARFDHHCVWVNNCVGHLNHRPFFALLCLIISCHWVFLFYVSKYLQRAPTLPSWMDIIPFLITLFSKFSMLAFLCTFHFIHSFWELWVLLDQAHSIGANITTNEGLFKARYFYLHNSAGQFANPFDRGTRENWKEWLTHSVNYFECFPIITPVAAAAPQGTTPPV